MTLNAVQQWVKGLLDGAPVPGDFYPDGMKAHVAPLLVGKGDFKAVHLFIWGARTTEDRISIGRQDLQANPNLPGGPPAPFKEATHSLTIWMYGLEVSSDKNRDVKFPVAVEAVKNILRQSRASPVLTDNVTGETSKLMGLGEVLDSEYDQDRTLADQRTLRNLCRYEVSVKEEFRF